MNLDFVLTDCFAGTMDEFMAETETNTNDYATWAAEMDTKLKAAIAEDELDINDDFYAEYKGVVKPTVYFNGYDNENQQTYDYIVDNAKPIYPVFE